MGKISAAKEMKRCVTAEKEVISLEYEGTEHEIILPRKGSQSSVKIRRLVRTLDTVKFSYFLQFRWSVCTSDLLHKAARRSRSFCPHNTHFN